MYYYANKLQVIAMAVAAVAAFSSCSQGESVFNDEAYFNEQKAKYEKSWKEKFGAIDPTQNWNMATQAKANIAVPSGRTVNVYKSSPLCNRETAIG